MIKKDHGLRYLEDSLTPGLVEVGMYLINVRNRINKQGIDLMIQKKIVLLYDNDEIYNSFKRAFKAIANIEVEKYSNNINKNVVVMYMKSIDNIEHWMWKEFRKKSLNPLIAIGFENNKSFINKNPVFVDYYKEHAYIQIPFDLTEILSIIKDLKPIYDNVTKKIIINDYSKGYEYILITHDLKIIKGNKTATIDNLIGVKEFYHSKGDSKVVKTINEKIKEIETNDDWEQIAFKIKQDLEEKLKGRNKI